MTHPGQRDKYEQRTGGAISPNSLGLWLNLPSIEPELLDVARVGLQVPSLDALDDVGEHGVGAGGNAHLLALAYHVAVEQLDLGAPTFLHVLAHRRALLR